MSTPVDVPLGGKILVVEDDQGVRDVVAFQLEREGFDVLQVADGEQALEALADATFDLVVLDLMLPGRSGIDVCRELRAQDNQVPILILTARDAELDRVLGLELGADDYVTKPFSARELVSRIRAILRRRAIDLGSTPTQRQVGRLRLDFERREVALDERTVRLTPSEFRLLTMLAERPGQVLSRTTLMQRLWDSEHVGDEHACDVHISNLRRKIEEDPSRPKRLVTVRGAGYRLEVA